MENKYIKYLQLSNTIKHFDSLNSLNNTVRFEAKWLSYLLLAMAVILWITFNIVTIENNQFSPYVLVFMNIILYCIIAVMASPDHYSESESQHLQQKGKV
jgi:hypothetical protein